MIHPSYSKSFQQSCQWIDKRPDTYSAFKHYTGFTPELARHLEYFLMIAFFHNPRNGLGRVHAFFYIMSGVELLKSKAPSEKLPLASEEDIDHLVAQIDGEEKWDCAKNQSIIFDRPLEFTRAQAWTLATAITVACMNKVRVEGA